MNIDRRKFLKIVLIGGASFIVGKVFGPLFSKFIDNFNSDTNSNLGKIDSSKFKIIENDRVMSILDNSGEEIFQIDNKA